MLSYIETRDESSCCGCRACEQVCVFNAIIMEENEEGFFYPVLNRDLCASCGLCQNTCPQIKRPIGSPMIDIYAIQHKDNDILKKSSSGGAFRLLADEIISEGGCVVGCIWNKKYEPVLTIAETVSELEPMQGSKYLSSSTGKIYITVEQRLKKGQKVLFTGSPCQCAGLINFLKKPYDNLFVADFLCHGMPSQKMFNYHLDNIEKKHNLISSCKERKITSYKFRDKEKRGWGIVASYTWIKGKKNKKNYNIEKTDAYDFGFINGYFNRYSCYTCQFRGQDRFTDFTFCDYWGINKFHSEISSKRGVSALSINTEKAKQFREKLANKAIWIKTNPNNVARENPTLLYECREEIPNIRREIYSFVEKYGWKKTVRRYLRPKNYYLLCFWYGLPENVAKKLKKVLK